MLSENCLASIFVIVQNLTKRVHILAYEVRKSEIFVVANSPIGVENIIAEMRHCRKGVRERICTTKVYFVE